MSTLEEPILEPPGAGLPEVELFFGRLIFALKCRTGSRGSFTAQFERERSEIRSLVDSCGEEQRSRRVLIPRLRGLEDSSRHWSVWMTLDHLRITNEAFSRVISSLVRGSLPEGVASTAAVKPDPAVGGEVDAMYEKSCDDLLSIIARAGDLRTELRYAHPWFGPLDASRWHALSAMHMGIHRAQIARILSAAH